MRDFLTLLWSFVLSPIDGGFSERCRLSSFPRLFLSLWLCWFSSSLSSFLVQEERVETRKLMESRWLSFLIITNRSSRRCLEWDHCQMHWNSLSFKSQSCKLWFMYVSKLQQFDPKIKIKNWNQRNVIVTHVVVVGIIWEHKHHHRGWRYQRYANTVQHSCHAETLLTIFCFRQWGNRTLLKSLSSSLKRSAMETLKATRE